MIVHHYRNFITGSHYHSLYREKVVLARCQQPIKKCWVKCVELKSYPCNLFKRLLHSRSFPKIESFGIKYLFCSLRFRHMYSLSFVRYMAKIAIELQKMHKKYVQLCVVSHGMAFAQKWVFNIWLWKWKVIRIVYFW